MLLREIVTVESAKEVGLFRHEDGRCVLHVPYGMAHLAPTRALALLYMSFIVFRRTRRALKRLHAVDGVERQPGHGLEPGDQDVSFCDALALDELFDQMDPRSVLSLCDHPARIAHDVHRRIDRHLHQALFDDDGAAYIDRVLGHRRVVRYGKADIVGLYCFLALDFYQNFLNVDPAYGWGNFVPEGTALAADFQHRYLTPQDSLYLGDPALRERCREQMRHVLYIINRSTPLRDAQYRKLHDALYRYLHAGIEPKSHTGQVWGVNDFWAVWESACLSHAATQARDSHLSTWKTCDFEHLPQGLSSAALEKRWVDWRLDVFARNDIHRRPDLVLNLGAEWTIVDFKYHREPTLQRPKWQKDAELAKVERDFLSMEVYGLLLKNHLLCKPDSVPSVVKLEMWLPGTVAHLEEVRGTPGWDPALSVRRLPTAEVLAQYGALYGKARPGPSVKVRAAG